MAVIVSSPVSGLRSMSRTRPTKQASPPMSRRPSVSRDSSTPISKSASWTRIIRSASRHRREQGDLIRGGDRVVGPDIFEIDRDLHHAAISEHGLVGRPPRLEPVEQLADRGDARRRRELLARLAELAAKPGEIEQLHQPTSPKGRKSTMLPRSTRVNASGSSTSPSAVRSELRIPLPWAG